MTTICNTCGGSFAADARFCSQCGTPTSSYYAQSAASPHEPTALPAPSKTPLQVSPTDYGANSYGIPPQNPYELPNPYDVPLRPPPQPRRFPTRLTILLLASVLLLIGGSVVIYNFTVLQTNQLHVQATAQAQSTATVFAHTPQGIYNTITRSTPILDSPLSSNDAISWDETNDNNGACFFTGGAYHAIIRPAFNGGIGCFSHSTHFSDLAYQVEMTIIKGHGGGGILFRNGGGPDPNGWGYQFGLFQDHVGLWYTNAILSSSTAIKAKLNQTYLLTAIVRGNSFNVYIDKHWVGSAVDNTSSSGSIGLSVYDQSGLTEVVFRNVKVWKL